MSMVAAAIVRMVTAANRTVIVFVISSEGGGEEFVIIDFRKCSVNVCQRRIRLSNLAIVEVQSVFLFV